MQGLQNRLEAPIRGKLAIILMASDQQDRRANDYLWVQVQPTII